MRNFNRKKRDNQVSLSNEETSDKTEKKRKKRNKKEKTPRIRKVNPIRIEITYHDFTRWPSYSIARYQRLDADRMEVSRSSES